MTEGDYKKKIVKFAVPVFMGSMFQQFYSVIDTIIVGRFVGEEALASVSSTSSLVFLIVGFFGGLFTGVGVVISKYFGAKDDEYVKKSVGNSVFMGIVTSILLTIIGTIAAPKILTLMNIPENVFDDALSYITIYFAGISFLVFYNVAAGIFQAVGDSKHPLYYLIVSSILNIVLDLVFVIKLDMGVAGAATATVIAQCVSSIFAFQRLFTVNEVYRLKLNMIRCDVALLKEMLRIGVPGGLQSSAIAISHVFIQSSVNTFGSTAMAGYGAYSKLEGFAFIPVTSFATSLTTYVGQNLGAKNYQRAKDGARFGIIISCSVAQLIGIFFFFASPVLMLLFTDEQSVIDVGVNQATVISLFYGILAFSHAVGGILRGSGRSIIPMAVMFTCWCAIRVAYITVALKFVNEIEMVYWAFPVTWILSLFVFMWFYFKTDWIHGLEKTR